MRILIVILAAMAIGIGLGYTRMSTEFNGVEEKFTVFRQVLSTSNSQTASTDQTTSVGKSAEAEIPIANLLENPHLRFRHDGKRGPRKAIPFSLKIPEQASSKSN